MTHQICPRLLRTARLNEPKGEFNRRAPISAAAAALADERRTIRLPRSHLSRSTDGVSTCGGSAADKFWGGGRDIFYFYSDVKLLIIHISTVKENIPTLPKALVVFWHVSTDHIQPHIDKDGCIFVPIIDLIDFTRILK